MDWRDQAACREVDPELFFPLTDQGPSRVQEQAAVQHCMGCQVREKCLDWALDNEIHHGVWGAATEQQRLAIIRGRQIDQDLHGISQRYRVSA